MATPFLTDLGGNLEQDAGADDLYSHGYKTSMGARNRLMSTGGNDNWT